MPSPASHSRHELGNRSQLTSTGEASRAEALEAGARWPGTRVVDLPPRSSLLSSARERWAPGRAALYAAEARGGAGGGGLLRGSAVVFRAVAVCVHCRSIIEEQARFCPHCGRPLSERRPRSKIELGVELDLGWGKAMVGERIGEGGMGVVYRGWLYYNPAGPRGGSAPHPVAIKALNPLLRGHQRARQLFLGEASALERLDHPNIVRFFGLL